MSLDHDASILHSVRRSTRGSGAPLNVIMNPYENLALNKKRAAKQVIGLDVPSTETATQKSAKFSTVREDVYSPVKPQIGTVD